MSCPAPASTGVPILQLMVLGAALLVAGSVLLLAARRGEGWRAMPTLVMLVLFAALLAGGTDLTEARAATPGCSFGTGAAAVGPGSTGIAGLTITQTSTMTGLAPGIAPAGITGIVTNHGDTSTYVTAVTVSISAVTAPHQGRCSAADYVLLDTVMPVARTLAPGESKNFGGASIGFRNRAINQDSCQRAVVTLRYVSS